MKFNERRGVRGLTSALPAVASGGRCGRRCFEGDACARNSCMMTFAARETLPGCGHFLSDCCGTKHRFVQWLVPSCRTTMS